MTHDDRCYQKYLFWLTMYGLWENVRNTRSITVLSKQTISSEMCNFSMFLFSCKFQHCLSLTMWRILFVFHALTFACCIHGISPFFNIQPLFIQCSFKRNAKPPMQVISMHFTNCVYTIFTFDIYHHEKLDCQNMNKSPLVISVSNGCINQTR